MSYYRTPEHRKRQSELIRRLKPWEKSTGPRSEEGKAVVSQNAFKGGWRQEIRDLRRMMREMDASRMEIFSDVS